MPRQIDNKIASQPAPHFCRKRHDPIRHWDDGDDERCPLCRAVDRIAELERYIEMLQLALDAKEEVQ